MKIKALFLLAMLLTVSSIYAWQTVENLGSPPNSSAWEYQCSIDDDGDKIFFERDSGKIYISEKVDESWTTPEELPYPINDPGTEYPFWDSANNDLYFIGGDSSADIFYCHWNGSNWEGIKHSVGSEINSGVNEFSPCLSPDGNYFYFTRNGDIYVADWDSGSHTGSNVRLTGIGSGYPGSYHDGCLYFSDGRAGGEGAEDIWKAEGSGSNFSTAENLGSDINTSDDDAFPSWTTVGWMFFASNRSGGYGAVDLYRADYNVAIQPASLGSIKAMFH